MDASGAAFLRDANDEHFEVFAGHHHKIGHLVYDKDDIGHAAAIVFLFVAVFVGYGDLAALHFGVIVGDVFDTLFGH